MKTSPKEIPCPSCDGMVKKLQDLSVGIFAAKCDKCLQTFFLGQDLWVIDNDEVAYDNFFWEFINAHRQ